ncbi:GM25523 [Drosophila sechellia]|uniref:GM25523 n=1 Tax=Drosophila sechellia TaxID=7238 RepID=B4HI71_DROSE|nr:GM25523 [Drosophila sechellia]
MTNQQRIQVFGTGFSMLDFGFWILALRSVNTYVKQGLPSDEINPLRRFDPHDEIGVLKSVVETLQGGGGAEGEWSCCLMTCNSRRHFVRCHAIHN